MNSTNNNNKINKLQNTVGYISNSTNYTGVLNNQLYSSLAQSNPVSNNQNNNNTTTTATITNTTPVRRSTRSSSNALTNTANPTQKRYCT